MALVEQFVSPRLRERGPPDLAIDAPFGQHRLDRPLVVVLVAPEDQHVGVDAAYRLRDVLGVARMGRSNRVQRLKHPDALVVGENRFLVVHALAVGHDDVESLAHRGGLSVVADVARVEEVEGSRSDDSDHRGVGTPEVGDSVSSIDSARSRSPGVSTSNRLRAAFPAVDSGGTARWSRRSNSAESLAVSSSRRSSQAVSVGAVR
jgi:hypothetical protein